MKSLLVFFMMLYASGSVFSQDLIRPSEEIKKSDLKISELSLKNPKPELSIDAGGIFISPFIGFEFPVQEFSNNSKGTFDFGVKLEFAHSKIYPFVVGGFVQYESHEGTDEIKTANFLTAFKTDITSFGGSIDIILNKFLKSDFTIPFVTVEVKMMNVKRVITPEDFNPGYVTSDNVIGIGGGLGFTLFIFDIVTTYNHAGDYSTFGLKTRFHYPLIKF